MITYVRLWTSIEFEIVVQHQIFSNCFNLLSEQRSTKCLNNLAHHIIQLKKINKQLKSDKIVLQCLVLLSDAE